jgi:ubiquinone/menaquinone biosynthesis C-methylase UbiE
MIVEEVEFNTSYEPFSKEPEYIEANRAFIQSLPLKEESIVLDLACGTGALPDLIFEVIPNVSILGIDLSRESLLLAQQHFGISGFVQSDRGVISLTSDRLLLFIEGTADVLPVRDQCIDVIVMGNAIHNLPDTDKLLREVYRAIRPGGLFAFSSTFYANCYPPGTERFHHEWLKLALLYIMAKDTELKRQGRGGVRRKRGTVSQAFSRRWLSLEEWTDILRRNGFDVTQVFERPVVMNQRCFEKVGAYAGLASVLLSGFPVKLACEALVRTAGPALDAAGVTEVPRLWLEMGAVKR